MFVYSQTSGQMRDVFGDLVGIGYSGFEEGKNAPALENKVGIGPIPRGCYSISPLWNSYHEGPDVMTLTPDSNTPTYGRSGFLIHGDGLCDPGKASHGCIILDHASRLKIGQSTDKRLLVDL